jgi:hypothetical protein
MAVDPVGNRYLAILLQNNRTAPDPLILPGRDPTRVIVVQKISVEGKVVYTAWLLGISERGLPKIAVNAAGEVYLGGITQSDVVTATQGAIAQGSVSGDRGFVIKLNAAGDRILTTATLAGFLGATVVSLTLDPKENIYLAVRNVALNATPGSFNPAPVSGNSFASNFVIKLNPSAGEILFISPVTEFSDTLNDLTVDTEGNLYVAGLAGAARTAPPYLRELVSRDGGATWNLIRESSFSELDGRSGRIVVHPKEPEVLFEPGRGGIFRSTTTAQTGPGSARGSNRTPRSGFSFTPPPQT